MRRGSAAKPKAARPKRCDPRKGGCGQMFTPVRPMQAACCQLCALNFVSHAKAKAAALAAKEERKADKVKLDGMKSRQDWLKECQSVINSIVRLRDIDEPCISCDRPAAWSGQWHASHLRSVGSASAVRFHLWNIHKACSICNNHLSGNIAEYLPRVRKKIGDEKVDWLYTQNHLAKHNIDYLRRLKSVMSRKLKRMERRHAMQGRWL